MYASYAIKKRRKVLTGAEQPGFLGGQLEASTNAEASFESIIASMKTKMLDLTKSYGHSVLRSKEEIFKDLAYSLVRVSWWSFIEGAMLLNKSGLRIAFKDDDLAECDYAYILTNMAPLLQKVLNVPGRFLRRDSRHCELDLLFDKPIDKYMRMTQLTGVKIKRYTNVTRIDVLRWVLLMRKARAFLKPVWRRFPHLHLMDSVRRYELCCGALRILARLPFQMCKYTIEFL